MIYKEQSKCIFPRTTIYIYHTNYQEFNYLIYYRPQEKYYKNYDKYLLQKYNKNIMKYHSDSTNTA